MPALITADLVSLDETLGDDRFDVIRHLAGLVAEAGRATSAQDLYADAKARESKTDTGIPGGIAIPHCRSAAVTEASLAVARLPEGRDFGAKDGPADLVFFIAAPDGADQEHLKLLSTLARSLMKKDFTAALRAASTSHGTSGLWLSRVCKTAAHELGHCFALDHCVYYSCIMQATASMEEDDRQPPFLCPVCLPKLSSAVLMAKPGADKAAERNYIIARYEALRKFCLTWPDDVIFAGFAAWMHHRLRALGPGR